MHKYQCKTKKKKNMKSKENQINAGNEQFNKPLKTQWIVSPLEWIILKTEIHEWYEKVEELIHSVKDSGKF